MPPQQAEDLRALTYGRNSKAKDASIAKQFFMGRTVSEQERWNLIGELSDKVGASRMSSGGRDDWDEVNRLVGTKAFDILILLEASRGDRDAQTWLGFLKLCRDNGVKVYVISNERLYNIARARDWKDLAYEGIDAAYETEVLSQRTKDHMAFAAKQGTPPNVAPFGYRKVRDERSGKPIDMVPDMTPRPSWIQGQPDYKPAVVVLECFKIIAGGKGQRAVQRYLNDAGVPAPRSGPLWSYQSIRNMLRCRTYMGDRVSNDEVVKKGCFTPVVPPALWYEVAALFASGSVPTKGGSEGVKYLLTGNVGRCCCGGRLSVIRRGGRDPRYRCESIGYHGVKTRDGHVGSALMADVDDYVLITAGLYLGSADFVARINRSANHPDVDIKLHREIDELEAEIREWDERAGTVRAAVYDNAVKSRQAEIAEKKALLERGRVPDDLSWLLGKDRVAQWRKRCGDIAVARRVVTHLFEIVINRPDDGKRWRPASEYVTITERGQ